MSYLNSPRKGCPRGMKICVWTHLGLIKWKTTSKKKWKTTSKKKWKMTSKNKWKTTSKKWEKNCFLLAYNQSTEINLIGCDPIVNSSSSCSCCSSSAYEHLLCGIPIHHCPGKCNHTSYTHSEHHLSLGMDIQVQPSHWSRQKRSPS